jgi:hypothetical protein
MSSLHDDDYWGDRRPERPPAPEPGEGGRPAPQYIEGRLVIFRLQCPCCNSQDCSIRSNKNGFPMMKCRACGKWIECVYL